MKNAGFTLIELLLALIVVAILASLATPPLGEMIAAQRRLDAATQYASGLRTARLEALLRNQVTVLHAIDDDWSKGWRISLSPSGKWPQDDSAILLIEHSYSGKVPIGARMRNQPYVIFNRLGAPSNQNGTIYVCEKGQAVSHYQVVLAVTGRVTLTNNKQATPYCAGQDSGDSATAAT